ncbi:hypothetical protein RN001_010620 [Aquatica leii]|uniref:Ethylmalonyl-CoA decarboxylase n=1 Tax=Aquatica leii TaxID=1421715 RepID=A0AAN7SG55_9COLE|nr:hypothetical protein RN001_010620 [Aquatica leii]
MALVKNSFDVIRTKLNKYPGGKVLLEKDDNSGIARIILDHPERCNALSGHMMVELRDCVEDLETWVTGKGVILTGWGTNFCSGADLNFARASSPQDGFDMSVWMQDVLVRLQKLPLVSCCLVHGASIGGGSELSVFCDYIVAADDVKYGFVQGKMGITTAWGGGTRLALRVGQRKALDLLLTSKVMNARECFGFGIVDAIVSSERALHEVTEWFSKKLRHEREVIRVLLWKETFLLRFEEYVSAISTIK